MADIKISELPSATCGFTYVFDPSVNWQAQLRKGYA